MTKSGFNKGSGHAGLKKLGELSGKLLGKLANGLEAVEAMKLLVEAEPNSFMEKAREAINVSVQKLDAIGTIAYANKDDGFNPSISAKNAFKSGLSKGYQSARKQEPERKQTGPSLAPA